MIFNRRKVMLEEYSRIDKEAIRFGYRLFLYRYRLGKWGGGRGRGRGGGNKSILGGKQLPVYSETKHKFPKPSNGIKVNSAKRFILKVCT